MTPAFTGRFCYYLHELAVGWRDAQRMLTADLVQRESTKRLEIVSRGPCGSMRRRGSRRPLGRGFRHLAGEFALLSRRRLPLIEARLEADT